MHQQNSQLDTVTASHTQSVNFVRYCLNGEWRWLCGGGDVWGPREAIVTCRQLGMEGKMINTNYNGIYFYQHRWECWYTLQYYSYMTAPKFFRLASNCIGTENSIEECGGIVEIDSCPTCVTLYSYGILQCESGK